MPDQLQDIVSRMVAAGESESDIALVIQQFSHQAPQAPKRPEEVGASFDPDYMGGDPNIGQRGLDRLPAIAGGAAGMAAGPGIVLPAIAAGGGGYLGARVRGDSREDSVGEGIMQAITQGGSGMVAKLLSAVAKPIYRAAIPKAIQDKFSQADLAGQGLDSRVVLGTKGGSSTASAANAQAGNRVSAAANTVPEMTAQDVQGAFRPKYNKALVGRRPEAANEINAHVRQSMNEIGPQPMNGNAQLARKAALEPESGAAMRAPNPNMSATNPQLANIERKAITKNLRLSPEMANALDKSQAAVGVQRAAKATENSSAVNRLAHGGVWNAMRSPAGLSGTAIGMNELANVPFAELLRLAQIAQLQGQQE